MINPMLNWECHSQELVEIVTLDFYFYITIINPSNFTLYTCFASASNFSYHAAT
jgi:hypothetical protein